MYSRCTRTDWNRAFCFNFFVKSANQTTGQSRSQSPRSSVGGIVGLWGKAQKNARNSLHSIAIGSSTPGKRAIYDGALAIARS